jgi:hypothetical protein
LGRTLREDGGLPCLPALADIVQHFSTDPNHDFVTALARLRAIERSFGGRPLMMLGSRVASRLIAELSRGESLPSDLATELAVGSCREILDHHLFSRALPELVGNRFTSDDEANAWRDRCLAELDDLRVLRRVAAQLVRDNSGKRIRVRPSRSAGRKTTADLLNIGVE